MGTTPGSPPSFSLCDDVLLLHRWPHPHLAQPPYEDDQGDVALW